MSSSRRSIPRLTVIRRNESGRFTMNFWLECGPCQAFVRPRSPQESFFPVAGTRSTVNVEGYQPREDEDMAPYSNIVSPDYFATMRMPIVAGRDFNEHDNLKSGGVGIINQTMAHYFFGNRNPIGKKFGTDSEHATGY